MTVADMFDAITHRLDTLLVQADHLAEVNYDWGKEEHISTNSFIREYIEHHKDARFQLIQERSEPFITKTNDLGELEDMFSIIFPKRALETVFDNIVSNAVSHGFVDKDRKDYKILFSELFDDFDRFVIKISNNGVPLPESTKTEDVFVYGYSTSLNAETHDGKEHHGLGGYDTRNILKKYGADVKIISSPEEEYTVTYVLTFTKTDLIYE
jgi:signal transduction histidine kinase